MFLIPDKGFRWTHTWRTDVMEAYDGTEQRVRLASLPRMAYAGALFLEDADLADARSLVAFDPDAAFDLPVPFETVASVNAITGTTITIVPTYVDWNTVGRTIYIHRPDGTAYTTTITVVAGAGATLTVADAPPAGTWPAGSTTVTPIEAIKLEDGQPFSRWQTAAGRWEIAGRQSTARALGGFGAAAITQQDAIDVLHRRPLVDGMAQEQIVGAVSFQDAGGALSSSQAFTATKPRRTWTWTIRGPAERQWWKSFLSNRKGRWSTFLAPTWRPDLLATTATAGALFIRISSTYANYLTRWWPSLAHRRIQIAFSDGSIIYRTISATTDLGGGIQELTLTAALPGPLPGTVASVSLLELARLDVDEVTIGWDGNMLGRVSLPLVVVQG